MIVNEALRSRGWQTPSNGSANMCEDLNILYPSLTLKKMKSQRMSLMENTNATLDEKEMRQIKSSWRTADKEFKDWEDEWKQLKIETSR